MSKFVRHFFRSQRSVAFTLIVMCQVVLAMAPTSAFAKTNKNAYVTSNINGELLVVDTKTDTVTATIPGFLHPFCVHGVAERKTCLRLQHRQYDQGGGHRDQHH